jgi:hypothetical protein
MSHDTSEFYCNSIAHWWRLFGCQHYPTALTLLVLCDGGGSNAPDLQIVFADIMVIRAHTCAAVAAGSTNQAEVLGRSVSGYSTKLHAIRMV